MWTTPVAVADTLRAHHYLGPTRRGVAWQDDYGVIVVSPPTSRRLPTTWLELTRWCIVSREKNSGSRQWAAFIRALRMSRPDVTTIVSYSDPAQGHTGALYRACNWIWAPTWHRLRPPPSGNGRWSDRAEGVKDRWVFLVASDAARSDILVANDPAVLRKYPWARYAEPRGADYATFKKQVLA